MTNADIGEAIVLAILAVPLIATAAFMALTVAMFFLGKIKR